MACRMSQVILIVSIAFGSGAEISFTDKERKSLENISAEKGFRYVSGNDELSRGKFPTIYAYTTSDKEFLRVVSLGCDEHYAMGDVEKAIGRYKKLLSDLGYGSGRLVPVVADKTKKGEGVTKEEEASLRKIPGMKMFVWFSGYKESKLDHPTLVAFGRGGDERFIKVLGRECDEEFALKDLDKALPRYKKLLNARGYHPPK